MYYGIPDNYGLFELHEAEQGRLERMGKRLAYLSGAIQGAGELQGAGYAEMGTGVFVPEEEAFSYALGRCLDRAPEGIHRLSWTPEFREMLVGWFYSGNWVKEEQKDGCCKH